MKLQSLCLENYSTAGYKNKNGTVCKLNPTNRHAAVCCKWAQCLEKAGAPNLCFVMVHLPCQTDNGSAFALS